MSGVEALFARVLGEADAHEAVMDSLVPMPNRDERESGRRLVREVRALAAALPTVAQDEGAHEDEVRALSESLYGLDLEEILGVHDEQLDDVAEAVLRSDWLAARLAAVAARGDTADAEAVDMCWEFVDTGTCGHSDAEHDALADAARGDTPGAAAARAWDEGYAARRSEGPDSPGESNPYRAALSPEARP